MTSTTEQRILIVDDDAHIREVIRFALAKAGFATGEAADGRAAVESVAARRPDLVVLDILMPEMDGLEVCRRLRRLEVPIPIVFLTSKSDEIDRVLGLELGGDDYVTKPFSPRELVARVRAVLRRTNAAPKPPTDDEAAALRHGGLRLDPVRHEVSHDGEEISLTVTEFALLRTLMGRPGKVYTRGELMERAYDGTTMVSDRTINSHVKRLRRKLAAAGVEPIETVHGLGYRLADDADA